MWPATMVPQQGRVLPKNYVAEPRVHLGSYFEIDVCAEAELADQYEYEVLVYDQMLGRFLVAAVEIVSPANKDRPESRRILITKCAVMLQRGVCVSIVDLVTARRFNMYMDLLDLLDSPDPRFVADPSALMRSVAATKKLPAILDFNRGPTLSPLARRFPICRFGSPINVSVPLELEGSYEETCRALRIP